MVPKYISYFIIKIKSYTDIEGSMMKFALAWTISLFIFANHSAASTHLASTRDESKGVYTPESILPAGIDGALMTNPYTGEQGNVRKGTVGALINNVALLNKVLPIAATPAEQQQINNLIAAVDRLIPALRFIGLFDLVPPKEWLKSEQPGRNLVAALYLRHYPAAMTPAIRKLMARIKRKTKIKSLATELEKTLVLSGN